MPSDDNNQVLFESLQRLQDKITEKFEEHSKDEFEFHRKTEERLASVEANINVMTDYVKKVTDILERLTVIEERDRNRHLMMSHIENSVSELKLEDEKIKKELSHTAAKLTRFVATFSGGFAVIAVVWTVIGSSINSKLEDFSTTLDKVKIHMEVDKPVGWPPAHVIDPYKEPKR